LIERIDELEARQNQLNKTSIDEHCDHCEAESVCAPRNESPVKLAMRI